MQQAPLGDKKSKVKAYNEWYNAQPHVIEYRRNKAQQRRENPEERKKHREREKIRMSDTRYRFYRLCRDHGISVEEFAWMLHRQQSTCAGCCSELSLDRFTHIDHCHTTGSVRGILCHHCNLVLGQARDNATTLRRLADYLERSQMVQGG